MLIHVFCFISPWRTDLAQSVLYIVCVSLLCSWNGWNASYIEPFHHFYTPHEPVNNLSGQTYPAQCSDAVPIWSFLHPAGCKCTVYLCCHLFIFLLVYDIYVYVYNMHTHMCSKASEQLTEAAFLEIVATFQVSQKINYAVLVGMQDFQIQIMLQMHWNILICVAAQCDTVSPLSCVSCVPASCVHIWFVSCPHLMWLLVNSCPAMFV